MVDAEEAGRGSLPAEDVQVTCKFVTKLPEAFRAPEDPLTVPANLTRLGLSQVVNSLLGLEPPVPFDFLVQSELVRGSLEAHLASRGASAETLLEIEYVKAVLPPVPRPALPQEDWTSSLAPLFPRLAGDRSVTAADSGRPAFASASYDGRVRLWLAGSTEPAATLATSTAALKGVAVGNAPAGAATPCILYSAGDDGLVRAFSVDPALAPGAAAPLLAELRGATDGVASVAASPSGAFIAAGTADGELLLWERPSASAGAGVAPAPAAPAARASSKRRKGTGGLASEVGAAPALRPAARRRAHGGAVTALAWASEAGVLTGGTDRALRLWDVERGEAEASTSAGEAALASAAVAGAVLCAAAAGRASGQLHGDSGSTSGLAPHLFATGGTDGAVRLWDARVGRRAASSSLTQVRSLASHTDWVTALAWHPSSPHHLASASHDASAKLWDLRANVPLHSLAAPGGERLHAICWASPSVLAFAGASREVRVVDVDVE